MKSSISTQTSEKKPVHPAPPIQKRKAFVSQKSKTIQEESSLESSTTRPAVDTLVEQIQSDVESDSEAKDIPPQVKDSAWTNFNMPKNKSLTPPSPILLDLSTKSETPSISKNKETIITKLLEEEQVINLSNKQSKPASQIIDNYESSSTETLTESDSDSDPSEETKRDTTATTRQEDSSDDQILQNETQLAKQSLERLVLLLWKY